MVICRKWIVPVLGFLLWAPASFAVDLNQVAALPTCRELMKTLEQSTRPTETVSALQARADSLQAVSNSLVLKIHDLQTKLRKNNARLAIKTDEQKRLLARAAVSEKNATSLNSRLLDLRGQIAELQFLNDRLTDRLGRLEPLAPITASVPFVTGCVEASELLPVRNVNGIEFKPIGTVEVGKDEVIALILKTPTQRFEVSSTYVPGRIYSISNGSKEGDDAVSPLACWSSVTEVQSHAEDEKAFSSARFMFETVSKETFSIAFTMNHPILSTFSDGASGLYGVFFPAETLGTDMTTFGVSQLGGAKVISKVSFETKYVVNIVGDFPHTYFVGPSLNQLVLVHNIPIT